jgi:hypothetical protein
MGLTSLLFSSLQTLFTFVVTEWRMKFRREMNERDNQAQASALDRYIFLALSSCSDLGLFYVTLIHCVLSVCVCSPSVPDVRLSIAADLCDSLLMALQCPSFHVLLLSVACANLVSCRSLLGYETVKYFTAETHEANRYSTSLTG